MKPQSGKPRKPEVHRISINIAGLVKWIEKFRPGSSFSAAIREALVTFAELTDFLETHRIPVPRQGRIDEWWNSIEEIFRAKASHSTIGQLIQATDLVQLSDASGLSVKRLTELATGGRPRPPELPLLQRGLGVSLEFLNELYEKEFG